MKKSIKGNVTVFPDVFVQQLATVLIWDILDMLQFCASSSNSVCFMVIGFCLRN
jgi:hypothetical protein